MLPYNAGSVQAAKIVGHSLVLAKVELDKFRTTDLPAAWLGQLADSFANAREAGLKTTLRFSYDLSEGGQRRRYCVYSCWLCGCMGRMAFIAVGQLMQNYSC